MRVLVVGLGNIAQKHIRNLKALNPEVELAVWRQRPDPEGWQPPAGLPVDRWLYSDMDVHAWQPGAVIIANPATMHADTASLMATMFERPHLLIEKPIAADVEAADFLLDACERLGAETLMVGYDLRFYRPLQLVKEAIDAGRIGRPLSIRCEVGQYLSDWRPGRDYRTSVSARSELGGGVALELSHEIDYARWLMGEVAAVSAMTGRLSDLEIDVEDTADLLLRFESGALGSIHMDMTDRATHRNCRIVGTEGSIECDLLANQAWLRTGRPGPIALLVPEEPDGRWSDGNPFPEEMRHFLACCRGEATPPVDGADARRTLMVVEAAKRSAAEGREVSL